MWIGAYLADTMHLTTLQHGAYFLLLIAYWRERAALPDDDDQLRSITKLERSEWRATRPVLAKFFKVDAGVWWHKRVEHEIAVAEARSKKAAEKASKAAQARWGASPEQSTSNAPSIPQALPKKVLEECPTPSPTSSPSSKKISKASPSHPSPEGFAEFWLAWPKNDRKQDKAKCLEYWQRHELSAIAATIIADVRAKRGTRKWVEGFIEAPLVYLRNKRWEDGNTEAPDEDLGDWTASRSGVEGRGVALGLGKWDQDAFEHGRGEAFPAYEARVRRAVEQGEGVPA